jgi:hypothetical protein
MDKMSTRIFTPFVDPDTFLLKEVGFISNYFLRAVLMNGAKSMTTEVGSYLASMLRNPAMLSTHYHIFELWAIYQLRQGKALPIRDLTPQTKETEASRELCSVAKSFLTTEWKTVRFPSDAATLAVNAADHEHVQKYRRGLRLIMRAGFPAIDTVEDTWVFTNATTTCHMAFLYRVKRPIRACSPSLNQWLQLSRRIPLMRWPFSGW